MLQTERLPTLAETASGPVGTALAPRAVYLSRIAIMVRGPYARGLNETAPAALYAAMMRLGIAWLWLERGSSLAQISELVCWPQDDLRKRFREADKGVDSSLQPFVRDHLDAVLLQAAPAFAIRPGMRWKRLYKEYANLLADSTRLMDTLVEEVIRNPNSERRPPVSRLWESEIRMLAHLAGQPLHQRVTLQQLIHARFRDKVDKRRVAYMDAARFETADGYEWLVGISVGEQGPHHFVRGPEAGLAAQRLVLWFVRKYGCVFDVLVTDCHLAYHEGSFVMLLLQLGVEHFTAEMIIDNEIERGYARLRRGILQRALLRASQVEKRILNLLQPPPEEVLAALRPLSDAMRQAIRYDRLGSVEVIDGRILLGEFALDVPDGLEGVFTCGVTYEHPEDPDVAQWVKVELFRSPVPVSRGAAFPTLTGGIETLEVLAQWRLHINGVVGIRALPVSPIEDVPDVPTSEDELANLLKRLLAQGTGADPPDTTIDVTVRALDDQRTDDVDGRSPDPDLEKPDDSPTTEVHDPTPKGEKPVAPPSPVFPTIRLGASQHPTARLLGYMDPDTIDSIRSRRPFQYRAPSLRLNPDFTAACEAEGRLSRPKPLLTVIVPPGWDNQETLMVDNSLVNGGAVRRYGGLPEKLRASLSVAMEDVAQARAAQESRVQLRYIERAIAALVSVPLRSGVQAQGLRRTLLDRLQGARAAAGRGEVLVARAWLETIE